MYVLISSSFECEADYVLLVIIQSNDALRIDLLLKHDITSVRRAEREPCMKNKHRRALRRHTGENM